MPKGWVKLAQRGSKICPPFRGRVLITSTPFEIREIDDFTICKVIYFIQIPSPCRNKWIQFFNEVRYNQQKIIYSHRIYNSKLTSFYASPFFLSYLNRDSVNSHALHLYL